MPEAVLAISSVLLLIYVFGIFRFSRVNTSRDDPPQHSLNLAGVTAVIPFHNEKENIERLISQLPIAIFGEVILCNDHSTDGSADIAQRIADLYENMQVVHSGKRGKKYAIQTGVLNAGNNLILTMDCDIHVDWSLWKKFDGINLSPDKELWISPVRMEPGNGLFGRLQYFEWMALEAVKRSSWLLLSPLIANGAFLLFSRKTFLGLDSSRNDYHLQSGDDIFLLHSLIKQKGPSAVGWIDLGEHAPRVRSVSTWGGYITQKARWAGKNHKVRSRSYRAASLLFLSGQMGFILSILAIVLLPNWAILPLCLVLFKLLAEKSLINLSVKYFSKSIAWRALIPASLLYPFMVFAIALTAMGSSKSGNWTRKSPDKEHA